MTVDKQIMQLRQTLMSATTEEKDLAIKQAQVAHTKAEAMAELTKLMTDLSIDNMLTSILGLAIKKESIN